MKRPIFCGPHFWSSMKSTACSIWDSVISWGFKSIAMFDRLFILEAQVKSISDHIRPDRQCEESIFIAIYSYLFVTCAILKTGLMFSATMKPKVTICLLRYLISFYHTCKHFIARKIGCSCAEWFNKNSLRRCWRGERRYWLAYILILVLCFFLKKLNLEQTVIVFPPDIQAKLTWLYNIIVQLMTSKITQPWVCFY